MTEETLSQDVDVCKSVGSRTLGAPIKETQAGARLDRFLGLNFPFLSRSEWERRIVVGDLQVNQAVVVPSYVLKIGDVLRFKHIAAKEPPVERDIKVLWQHEDIIAVYKPGNLPMHENGPYRTNTFAALVAAELGPEWAAVHRLDRETSGIVLCGATAEIRQLLSAALASKKVCKEYLAIARGQPVDQVWDVHAPLGDLAESAIRIKKWVVEGGLPASTRFEVLGATPQHCLLRALPRTGRTNQIRIHAAYSDLPLVGDKLYHPNEEVFLTYFAAGQTPWVEEQTGFRRCCLHAAALGFEHPRSGEYLEVRCDLPADMSDKWLQCVIEDRTAKQ